MVSGDERAEETTGADPTWPTGQEVMVTSPAVNLMVAPEAPLLADPADTDDEKACRDAFQLIMQGFHTATRTFSDEYQEACKEVQTIVRKSLRKSTTIDCTFVWGASAAICQWVKAVHPAMDCIGESMEEQSRLLQEARQAGKEATEDILALLPVEESLYLTPVVPREDILTLALTATCKHTEKAIEAVNVQLLALVHRHVPPQQAGVFLASLLQVMCSYRQEMDRMATSQVVLPGQIVLNLWGVSQSMMEDLTLLGPQNCHASWPASLVERVSAEPANKATPVGLTTPVKHDTSSGNYLWVHLVRSQSCLSKLPTTGITQKKIRRMKNSTGGKKKGIKRRSPVVPCYLLMNTRNRFRFLLPKPFQAGYPRHLDCLPTLLLKAREAKARSNGPVQSSSTPQMMSHSRTKEASWSPKSRKRDHSTPDLMIVDDHDDPLPRRPKGMGKNEKSHVYT